MVELDIDDTTQTGQIVLRPNASGTWRFNLYLLYTLMIVSGTVSVGFLIAGAWMILPFSVITSDCKSAFLLPISSMIAP